MSSLKTPFHGCLFLVLTFCFRATLPNLQCRASPIVLTPQCTSSFSAVQRSLEESRWHPPKGHPQILLEFLLKVLQYDSNFLEFLEICLNSLECYSTFPCILGRITSKDLGVLLEFPRKLFFLSSATILLDMLGFQFKFDILPVPFGRVPSRFPHSILSAYPERMLNHGVTKQGMREAALHKIHVREMKAHMGRSSKAHGRVGHVVLGTPKSRCASCVPRLRAYVCVCGVNHHEDSLDTTLRQATAAQNDALLAWPKNACLKRCSWDL